MIPKEEIAEKALSSHPAEEKPKKQVTMVAPEKESPPKKAIVYALPSS